MTSDQPVLLLTAASVGFLHTLLGPDHYLPFAVMARAGRWSRAKTTAVTLACGLGHVLSSVVLGAAGIAFGVVLTRMVGLESFRDRIASWFLIAFGLVYFAWGVQRALRRRPHTHLHAHADGTVHAHTHIHENEHVHLHGAEPDSHASSEARLTPWILFTVFVTGPCKPLIPLLMYPAAQQSFFGVVWVTVVFGLATLATMLLAVLACTAGFERLRLKHFEHFSHALAGAAIALCGLAIHYLGL